MDESCSAGSAPAGAEALNLSLRTFQSRRAALAAAGFPRPLPGLRAPRWSAQLVEMWIANSGAAAPAPQRLPDTVAAARDYLTSRIAGRAA